MAISNPLIDDYTLKGAKGLLVNITGGEDLKLFEVDEVVNKIRAEVDVEAEVIIGAITDAALDGKIRVSIVATSLDGQQPESKSVINMVHRIQNRNPGYTDFGSNNGSAQSFDFSSTISSPVSNGANALKLENEVVEEKHSSISSVDINNEILSDTQETETSIVTENISQDELLNNHEQSFAEETIETFEKLDNQNSNGLENFGIEEESPELFNSEDNSTLDEITSDKKNELEEDDLEIPAFLRRQKN